MGSRNRLTSDLDRLEFSSRAGLNGRLILYRYRQLARFFRGRTCLELGCADGQGLEVLTRRFRRVVAVDGSRRLLNAVSSAVRSPKLTLVHSRLEDLDLGERFDTVFLGHVLEHVESPRRVIRAALRHSRRGTVLIADVPNANSIHRRIGVRLGLLRRVTELNEADVSIGHRRVYTPARFRREFEALGLSILASGGFFLKPLSNGQMERMLDGRQLQAFFDLGQVLPDLAAEMYVVCRVPHHLRSPRG